MKKQLFIFVFALSMIYAQGQTSIISYFDNCTSSNVTRIEADNNNNLYLGGTINGTTTIGGQSYSSKNGKNILCKINSAGSIEWVIQSHATVMNIKINQNDILVLWSYNESLTLFNKTIHLQKTILLLPALAPTGH